MTEEYERELREEALKTAKPVWLIWSEESEGQLRLFPKQVFLAWSGTRRAFLLDEHANTVPRACAETFETREHCDAYITHRVARARADAARTAVIAAARSAASAVQDLDAAEREEADARAALRAFAPHPRAV